MGSNHGPRSYQERALPLSHAPPNYLAILTCSDIYSNHWFDMLPCPSMIEVEASVSASKLIKGDRFSVNGTRNISPESVFRVIKIDRKVLSSEIGGKRHLALDPKNKVLIYPSNDLRIDPHTGKTEEFTQCQVPGQRLDGDRFVPAAPCRPKEGLMVCTAERKRKCQPLRQMLENQNAGKEKHTRYSDGLINLRG